MKSKKLMIIWALLILAVPAVSFAESHDASQDAAMSGSADDAAYDDDMAMQEGDDKAPLSPEERKKRWMERKAKWESMTPEQRAAHKAKMKEKWDAMTPEQRAKAMEMREKRKAMHREKMKEKWEAMTPEERAAHKAKKKEKWENMSPEQKARMKEKHDMKHEHKMERKMDGEHPQRKKPMMHDRPAPKTAPTDQ